MTTSTGNSPTTGIVPRIRLSERVTSLKASATLAVSAKVKAMLAAGVDVIGFGAGEPDFDTPDSIKAAAIDALRAGCTKYMPVAGDPDARRVIASKLQRENGIDCTPDDICISTGAKQSCYLAMQCLVDPGGEVILPTPAWVSYGPMIELAGGRVVEVPGSVDRDFRITPKQLEEAITPRTVALILNSPSNPCGTMYSPRELRDLAAVVAPRERISIVCDEIYEKLIFGGIEHLSLGSLEEIAARVITINGLSKAYAMTGWRIGYACGPNGAAKAMAKLQGQMTSNITSFCYAAIVEALTNGAADVERMRQAFAARAERMYGLVSAWPGIRCPRPTGAFYVFPDIGACFGRTSPGGRAIDSAVSFAGALLEEAHVAVVPGDDFGQCARTHVRLGFACSEQAIDEGCRRVGEWLAKLT